MREEEWREIPGWSDYLVSELGNLYSKRSGKYVTGTYRSGKRVYHLAEPPIKTKVLRRSYSADRLVAMAFLGMSDPKHLTHKDGNPLNDHYTNLQ